MDIESLNADYPRAVDPALLQNSQPLKSTNSPDSNISNDNSKMTAVERLKARLAKKTSDKSLSSLDVSPLPVDSVPLAGVLVSESEKNGTKSESKLATSPSKRLKKLVLNVLQFYKSFKHL